MLRKIAEWVRFIRDVASDERIPARTKAILLGMLAWLASPVDLIPDFIPILGYFDDLIVIVLLLDFAFNELPIEVLRDHYRGDEGDLLKMRKRTRWIGRCVPNALKRKLWGPVAKSGVAAQDGAGDEHA